MNNSREKICNILDGSLARLKEFEEENWDDQCSVGNSIVGSSVSLKDIKSSDCTEKSLISSSDSNDKPAVSGKPNKKWKWKKPKDKPKRPLSAYNLFFQHERENIISGGNSLSTTEILASIQTKKQLERPKEKQPHRKTHGKISFENLARSIADKWKTIDKAKREIFEKEANQEKLRYKKELEEWNRRRNEKSGLIPTHCASDQQETNHLLGLTTSVDNMIGSTNNPFLTACIPQMNNPMIFPNHPYYSEYKAYLQNLISQAQMQIFQEQMYPCASIMGSFLSCKGNNCCNCAQDNHLHDYDYNQSRDCAFVSSACQHSCHMSSTRCTCQHACDMLPVTMNDFHGTDAENPSQPCASRHTGKFNIEEFGRYYPVNETPDSDEMFALFGDDEAITMSPIDEPTNNKSIASFGDDEAITMSSNSANSDESSRSLQDDMAFFIKTLEDEENI